MDLDLEASFINAAVAPLTVDAYLPWCAPFGVLRTSRFFPEETVMFLFGEICPACGLWGYGTRPQGHPERDGITIGPYRLSGSAPWGNGGRGWASPTVMGGTG
ncbi:MAG: hypothetical protein ACREXW_15045 [Gammaproteobacteria bacterium]